MTGDGVKVTLVPEQILFDGLALMDTDGTNIAPTVIVILLLFTIAGVAHVASEVKTHATISPLTRLGFVYEDVFVPTLPPFNFH